jgi:hypothetical protein
MEGLYVIGAMLLVGTVGFWCLLPFLSRSLAVSSDLLCHVLQPWYATLPKSNMVNQSWTETSKTVSQNNLFLFINWLSQVCFIMTESWQHKIIPWITVLTKDLYAIEKE